LKVERTVSFARWKSDEVVDWTDELSVGCSENGVVVVTAKIGLGRRRGGLFDTSF